MFSSPYSFGPVAFYWRINFLDLIFRAILDLYVVRKRKGKQWTLIFSFLNAIMCNFLSYLQYCFHLHYTFYFTAGQAQIKYITSFLLPSCVCWWRSTMLPLCENEILSLSHFSINSKLADQYIKIIVQEKLLPWLFILSQFHSLWFYIWKYRLQKCGILNWNNILIFTENICLYIFGNKVFWDSSFTEFYRNLAHD